MSSRINLKIVHVYSFASHGRCRIAHRPESYLLSVLKILSSIFFFFFFGLRNINLAINFVRSICNVIGQMYFYIYCKYKHQSSWGRCLGQLFLASTSNPGVYRFLAQLSPSTLCGDLHFIVHLSTTNNNLGSSGHWL